jgi:CubicO group peptidase (beta-lactamase class C family)
MSTDPSRRGFLAGVGAAAATAVGPTAAAATGSAPARTATDPPSADAVRSFLNERLPAQLEEHDIAGATVSVVAGGERRVAEGYGLADVAAEEPVKADETLFRIGSVSKPITGTAVMRGVEAGRLALDTDVHEYVDGLSFPGEYDAPVTLEQLGTHTPGFESVVLGLFADTAESTPELERAIKTDPPARVRPPGELASYSNYGVGLAGYAASTAAGADYATHVRETVFEPLGMDRSTAAQPPGGELGEAVSKGYVATGSGFQERGFEFVPLRPAGSISATATDMARFVRLHLRSGEFDGEQYLRPETVAGMHDARVRNHPAVDGVGYGFYEMSRGDTRIVGHAGDTQLFHSLLALFPEQEIGMFVSYNTAGGVEARQELLDAFVDEFATPELPVVGRSGEAPARADELTGWYRGTRVSATEPAKLLGALGTEQVRTDDDGTLVTDPVAPGADPRRWVEVEPLVFRAVDGHERLAFRTEDGQITHMVRGALGGFRPLGPLEHPLGQAVGAAVSALLLVLTVVGWVGAGLYRALRDRPSMDRRPRVARVLVAVSGLLLLASPAGVVLAVGQRPTALVYGLPGWTAVTFAAPLVGAVGSVAAVGVTAFAWRERLWGPLGRVHYTVVTAALLVVTWLLAYWNLVGP